MRRVRHWPGGQALNSSLLASRDGVNFTVVATLRTSAVNAQTLPVNLTARYLAVRHVVK